MRRKPSRRIPPYRGNTGLLVRETTFPLNPFLLAGFRTQSVSGPTPLTFLSTEILPSVAILRDKPPVFLSASLFSRHHADSISRHNPDCLQQSLWTHLLTTPSPACTAHAKSNRPVLRPAAADASYNHPQSK